ncbi:YktB family protein [Calidifontibacillus erzurumensis]|uniref:YktB family protein n=1 Tax=Calidifontibacillus erzurumensis TaxID=2741433 RepID=UPI0035B4FBA8
MSLPSFTKDDFQIFTVPGLEQRMELIRSHIQPKFQAIGSNLVSELEMKLGNDMYLHIAKHARRTVNPPNDTWLAIAHDKRGYKKHPHFQVGLFDDHVFVWLAFIYELPNKKQIGQALLDQIQLIKELPEDYVISVDHTQKDAFPVTNADEMVKALERFRDIKKGEFLIGKQFSTDDPILQNGDEFINTVKNIFFTLLPIYKVSMAA